MYFCFKSKYNIMNFGTIKPNNNVSIFWIWRNTVINELNFWCWLDPISLIFKSSVIATKLLIFKRILRFMLRYAHNLNLMVIFNRNIQILIYLVSLVNQFLRAQIGDPLARPKCKTKKKLSIKLPISRKTVKAWACKPFYICRSKGIKF